MMVSFTCAKRNQVSNGSYTPFWGIASVEIDLHLYTRCFLLLCFARLLGPLLVTLQSQMRTTNSDKLIPALSKELI